MQPYANRQEAGRLLAQACAGCLPEDGPPPLILAIPRGGVVVGYQLAWHLPGDLDVIIPRKIGAPGQPELAVGAVTETGTLLVDEALMQLWRVPGAFLERAAQEEIAEVRRRSQTYRQGRPRPSIADRTVIVVDDGIATGFTMQAALKSVRGEHPQRLLVAVPVAPRETVDELAALVDEVVCLATPVPFYAVGQWYRDFTQVSDTEVLHLLEQARQRPDAGKG